MSYWFMANENKTRNFQEKSDICKTIYYFTIHAYIFLVIELRIEIHLRVITQNFFKKTLIVYKRSNRKNDMAC